MYGMFKLPLNICNYICYLRSLYIFGHSFSCFFLRWIHKFYPLYDFGTCIVYARVIINPEALLSTSIGVCYLTNRVVFVPLCSPSHWRRAASASWCIVYASCLSCFTGDVHVLKFNRRFNDSRHDFFPFQGLFTFYMRARGSTQMCRLVNFFCKFGQIAVQLKVLS